jgi:hypothetical protein
MYEVPDPVGTREKFLTEGQKLSDPADFQSPFKDEGQN